MRVEIRYTDDNPANGMLCVYDGGLRPICRIWDEDFAEILSEREYKRFEVSVLRNPFYTVKKSELFEKAKEIYPVY